MATKIAKHTENISHILLWKNADHSSTLIERNSYGGSIQPDNIVTCKRTDKTLTLMSARLDWPLS